MQRYGRVFGLVPVLEWQPVAGAKVPRSGRSPSSDLTGIGPSAVAPPGSWDRALNDLREANQVLRADMARRLGEGANIITRREGGAVVKAEWPERYAAEFGVRLRLRWVPASG